MRFDDVNKKFGAAVKERRTALRLSQQGFGESVGLSRASIANIERGEQGVSVQQLYEFAKGLNMSPEDLLPKYQYSEIRRFPRQTRSWIEGIVREAQDA